MKVFDICHATAPAAPASGAYEIVNTNTNKRVSVGGARTNKGAWIIQWDRTRDSSVPHLMRVAHRRYAS